MTLRNRTLPHRTKLIALCTPGLILAGCMGLGTVNTASQVTPPAQHPVVTPTNVVSERALSQPATSQLSVSLQAAEATSNPDGLSTSTEITVNAKPADSAPTKIDLWEKTRQHFKLDLSLDNPSIHAQLNWYVKHPRYIDRVTDRSKRYYYYVLEQVIKRDMPAEIALLPIVESAYDPFAYSHGRAAGPWQFIPGTAKHFGLKHSWWYDGRRDIQASTNAALDYLQQLNKRFDGDWLLALAAYNAGGGNVSKAIRKNRNKNKPTDFWSLKLPKETRAYVPKLIALAKLVQKPETYGVKLNTIANTPYFAEVPTQSQIDLAQAAEMANISTDELYLLNPGFNQWATDPDGPHHLLVPVANETIFRNALADLPADKRVTWTRYKIKSGDSLSTIAKSHRTTVEALKTSNSLRGSLIRAGQVLMIPTASKDAKIYALSAGQRQEKKTQRIALRSGKKKLQYKVQPGDSFWELSRRYKVGTRELASWNQMAPGDPLRIGKTLVIWQRSDQTIQTADGTRQVIRKVGYRVRSGDSLSRIAGRFNVKVSDIKRWNTLAASKYLQPGQQLTLYVDVTSSR